MFLSMGLGGGFLMTIWDARDKTARFLDARETAPAKARENMFEGNSSASMYGMQFSLLSRGNVDTTADKGLAASLTVRIETSTQNWDKSSRFISLDSSSYHE